MDKKGFTLVEMLVVIAVTAMLSGLAIVYTHIGQNQITLSIEESKVAQFILQAKELSIATYSTNSATCAYGVAFNYASSTYSLFEYNSAASSSILGGRPICPSLASTTNPTGGLAQYLGIYSSGSWKVHVAQGVAIHAGTLASTTIQDILFYPPDPCTFISLDGKTFTSSCVPSTNPPAAAYIYLSTTDGSAARKITVTSGGQVSL
jgi:prepilin-type N-terminal cleavage/methylation domain-containing protein